MTNEQVESVYRTLLGNGDIKTKTEFGHKLKVSRSYVSLLINGKQAPPSDFESRIKKAFPEIDLESVYNGSSSTHLVQKDYSSPEKRKPIVNKHGVRFEPMAGGKWRLTNKRVPFAAHAAYMAGWGDSDYIEHLPDHTMIVDQPTDDNYITFPVLGDCQDDNTRYGLVEGEFITGQSVPRSMWQYKLPFKSPDAEPFKVTKGKEEIELDDKSPRHTYWILISPKLGLRIAMIKKHDTATGILYCTCRNPDKKLHPDFEVQIDECNQIFFGISVERTL